MKRLIILALAGWFSVPVVAGGTLSNVTFDKKMVMNISIGIIPVTYQDGGVTKGGLFTITSLVG